ncbi:ABC transporter ATP-binding protein [Candidatus Cardinium hertigii]|uniref:Putative ABC transporter ATP-binding protein n=1 Tax=Candidatus Cardinium hertigii TaxID=247481 RepID=A0A2Z3LH77_9BACT|nr:ABC transporter ATP-binding protein [Candidatus Cardinium hertigii]AWN81400.1 putative ABC transporter ATP-binding protein [Candidatus Cardinium hertigii]
MRTIQFILKLIQPYRTYILGNIFVVLCASIDTNLRPYLIKLLINTAMDANRNSLLTISKIYAFVQIVQICLWTFNDWCLIQYSHSLRAYVITLLMERIRNYPYNFYQKHASGSIMAKINDASNLLPDIIFVIIYQFMQVTLSIFFALFLLARIHYILAVEMVIWISFFLIHTYFSISRGNALTMEYTKARANIWGYITDYLSNILNVHCFSREHYEKQRLHNTNSRVIENSKTYGYFLMRIHFFQSVLIALYTICFLSSVTYLQSISYITPGDLVLIFMLNFRIADKLNELLSQLCLFFTNWRTAMGALEVYNFPMEIQDQDNAKPIIVSHGQIIFDKVYFHYEKSKPLFQNISLTIQPRQRVGLVGNSGSGKTTFLNLILRLFNVNAGNILVDGQEVQSITRASLREAISVIPQLPTLFQRTIRENILYGKLDATDDEIIDAAKKAHAHQFIQQLSRGYETVIGAHGTQLSGGQIQRIAIARAFLNSAPILLLDESTSQLDPLTEKKIQISLRYLMQNKTTVIIAHKLSTLLKMDRILVFDQGQIVQDGTHAELLQQTGLYKVLWYAQEQNALIPTMDSVVS